MADPDVPGSADALTAFAQVCEVLSAHPRFKVVPARVFSGRTRRMPWLGAAIKQLRFLKFGAEFDSALTLLDFQLHRERPPRLVLDLRWHVTHMRQGLSVFIHFVDSAGKIGFHGDHPLGDETSDALGFLYTRKQLEVPQEVPAGIYRVRLGVWRPAENKLVALTRFRGCDRAAAEWHDHAVLLDTVEIGNPSRT